MEDQVVMTHGKQPNDKKRNEEMLCFAEQRPSYFPPFWCAYLSHIHFHFTSTRASPASRDSWSQMHVGVALPKQIAAINVHRSLTKCSDAPKGDSQCGQRHHTKV